MISIPIYSSEVTFYQCLCELLDHVFSCPAVPDPVRSSFIVFRDSVFSSDIISPFFDMNLDCDEYSLVLPRSSNVHADFIDEESGKFTVVIRNY